MSFIIPTFPSPDYTRDFCATCLAVGRDNILLQFFPFSEDITIILKHLLHDFDVDAFIQQLPPDKELKLCQACHKFLNDMVIFKICALRNFALLHNLWHYPLVENQLPSMSQTQYEDAIPIIPKAEGDVEPDPLEKIKIEFPIEITEESIETSIKVEKDNMPDTSEHNLDAKINVAQKMQGTVWEDSNLYVIPHINIVDVKTLDAGPWMPDPGCQMNNPAYEPFISPTKSAESTNLVATDQSETKDDSDKQNTKTNRKPRDRSKEKRIPWYITVVTRDEIIRKREEKLKDPKFLNALHKCLYCAKTFKKRHDLINHSRACYGKSKENAEFTCFACGCSFDTLSLLIAHAYYHSLDCHTYQCPTCEYTTGDKDVIPRHECPNEGGPKVPPKDANMKLSRRRRNYYCPKCDFMTTQQVNEHFRRFHSKENQVTCEACHKTYRNVHSFKAHWFLYHSGKAIPKDKLKKCDECPKIFHLASRLEKNKQMHAMRRTAENLYKCLECGNSYLYARGLNQHVRKKHGDQGERRNYICDVCGNGFTNKGILQKHMAKHSDERPYKCVYCGDTFKYSEAMFTHIKLRHKRQKRKGDTVEKKQRKTCKE